MIYKIVFMLFMAGGGEASISYEQDAYGTMNECEEVAMDVAKQKLYEIYVAYPDVERVDVICQAYQIASN